MTQGSLTQGSFQRSFMAHYKDLRGIYAKRMECHGNGMALMQPVSGEDCQPVCCGYFDRNGNWNLITRLTANDQLDLDDFFEPLEYVPMQSTDIDISWQPKTSLGVMAVTVDASGETPDGIPGGAGADVHIRYTSNSKFGAVLMTNSPVRLQAYNDEALFASWLSRNKARLYQRYGPELKKYGMWIVTRTYTTQRASINAWMDKNKTSTVSLKAKAAMLGELGEDLDWRDKALSKDWTTYQAKTNHGVVVFLDGIEVGPIDWWLEGIRVQLQSSNKERRQLLSHYIPDPIHHQPSAPIHQLGPPKPVLRKNRQVSLTLDDSGSQPRRGSRLAGAAPRRKSEVDTRRISQLSEPNPDQTPPVYSGDGAHTAQDYQDEDPLPSQAQRQGAQGGARGGRQNAQPPELTSQGEPPNSQNDAPNFLPPSHHAGRRISPAPATYDPRRSSHSSSSRVHHSSDFTPEPFLPRPREQTGSLILPPIRRIRNTSDETRPTTLVADEDILYDAGISSVSRSQSLRNASISSSIRTPSVVRSLRRESRGIHEEKLEFEGPRDDKAFEFFSKDMSHEMQGLLPPHMGLLSELR